jgi:hypothetical protein
MITVSVVQSAHACPASTNGKPGISLRFGTYEAHLTKYQAEKTVALLNEAIAELNGKKAKNGNLCGCGEPATNGICQTCKDGIEACEYPAN